MPAKMSTIKNNPQFSNVCSFSNVSVLGHLEDITFRVPFSITQDLCYLFS